MSFRSTNVRLGATAAVFRLCGGATTDPILLPTNLALVPLSHAPVPTLMPSASFRVPLCIAYDCLAQPCSVAKGPGYALEWKKVIGEAHTTPANNFSDETVWAPFGFVPDRRFHAVAFMYRN